MCNLCHDQKIIHIQETFGVKIEPCPKCNVKYRKRKGDEECGN